jgi:hypothetical protein
MTPLIPSRRQTSAALTATSTPITIIDQPIGFRMRPGRGAPSAASSAGAGSFEGSSDKAIWQVRKLRLLSLADTAKQTEA